MKKNFYIILILIGVFLLIKIDVSAKGISEIIINYSETNVYDEYLNKSYDFNFNNTMIKEEKIEECLSQINVNSDYYLEFVYNIFGEAQYLLIESTNDLCSAYIIYDFMLEEAIEYNENIASDWTNAEVPKQALKIYLNLNEKFYIMNKELYSVYTNELITEIDNIDNLINFPTYSLNSATLMSEIDVAKFKNKLIREEYDIKNSFFFENFYIDERYELNDGDSCAIVATSLLLSYYDVFYNDNIIDDYVNYENTPTVTSNNVAQNIFIDCEPNLNSQDISKYTDRFYIDTWNQHKYIKTGQCEFDGCLPPFAGVNFAGPTIKFHDYLLEIARNFNYVTSKNDDSMTILNVRNLINKYLETEGINGLNTHVNFDDSNIIECLKNDIPVIIGMSGCDYFCEAEHHNNSSNLELIGKKYLLGFNHAVVVYGYQKTSIGTFYHVNMGWGRKFESFNNFQGYARYNDVYLNANLMGFHTYIDASNLEHVCSNQYQLYDKNLDLVVSICPCQTLGDNINFIQYDDYFDYVDINNDETYDIQFSHMYDNYELCNEQYHIAKCRLYDECGKSVLIEHDFSLIGKSNDHSHYIKCSECGYTKYESHLYSDEEPDDSETHSQYCSFCLDYYYTEEHGFIYSGDDSSHIGICADCQYEQNIDTHEIQLSDHSESYHRFNCSCGYERYEEHIYNEELVCTICNHEHSSHAYNYSQYSSTKHLKSCPCGEEVYEVHSYVSDGIITRCRHCGYRTNGNVAINKSPVNNELLFINNSNYYMEVNRDEE